MLDASLWEECGHNPVLLLGTISQERLEECAQDDAILANLDRVWGDFSKYLESEATWYAKTTQNPDWPRTAYFSAEFGLAACVPQYSGGLGILAGDHLKSASDLGLPFVGVSLLYQRGYFRQHLDSDGWQQESYPETDFHRLPMRPARDADGRDIFVELPFEGKTLHIKVWRMEVGRVLLVLLDTNVPMNHPDNRGITSTLYDADPHVRIRQEFVLGVGGTRALGAVGIEPDIFHMNEGHSAFLALERVRQLMERHSLEFPEASLACAASTVFTTHTPVRAAIDRFSTDQMEAIFAPWREGLGLTTEEFMDLGRESAGDSEQPFNMAVFALRMADTVNGVSKLHGEVSRKMWRAQWPGVPEAEIPITSITNGIHSQTWISQEMREVFDRNLGPRWARDPSDTSIWEGVAKISTEELWRTHEVQRQRLVSFVRERMRRQLEAGNAPAPEVASVNDVLDATALTIGFARRFAPYKRASLVLRDPERLKSILGDPDRPVQFIFAGKAHPRDDEGKKLIQEIVHFARNPATRSRIVFIEDYDMDVAAHLVNGVDVWLNNPRRPMEASGTSGMKASANGALNLSVLDGWWAEAASEHLGWSIGSGEEGADPEEQDQSESNAFYDLLEQEIVPRFYERGRDGLPREWIRMMKEALKELCPVFNTSRMVAEYVEKCYLPVANRSSRLVTNGHEGVKNLARWRRRLAEQWPHVQVVEIDSDELTERSVGETVQVRSRVCLGELTTGEVEVQVYHGRVDAEGDLVEAEAVPMSPGGDGGDGTHWFEGHVPCRETGHRGFAIRVLPYHPELATSFVPGLIRWNSDPINDEEPVLA
jgi:starch phosphorylase